MKGRRKLRPLIEMTLLMFTILEIMFVVSIDDFELSGIPILILIICSIALNCHILKNYGRINYGA